MRLRDRYPVLLFDMNSTFAFGEDRFGESEDFSLAYRRLGGTALTPVRVNSLIRRCFEYMLARYQDAACCDDFVTVAESLAYVVPDLDPATAESLVHVFAEHEVGRIPDDHADYLRRLAREHTLGLVSNIWAPKRRFLQEFERAGIAEVFQVQVFSSDSRSIKPSTKLFLSALDALGASTADTLFVGDSLERDVVPARGLGMRTAWVAPPTATASTIRPDYRIATILELDQPA